MAMEAAGVRPVSEVVQGYVAEYVNPCEDKGIVERVSGRADLIRTILDGGTDTAQEEDRTSTLDRMRFIQVDHLIVRWRPTGFQ